MTFELENQMQSFQKVWHFGFVARLKMLCIGQCYIKSDSEGKCTKHCEHPQQFERVPEGMCNHLIPPPGSDNTLPPTSLEQMLFIPTQSITLVK